jgi:hypothetical protein
MAESNHKNPKDKKSEMEKIISQIDKEQLEDGSKTVGDIEDASQDLYPDEFTEEREGSIAPQEKSGSEEIEHSEDMRKRFAKKHSETTTKDSVLREELEQKTDKPSDENESE